MAATHDNLFIVEFLNVEADRVRSWLKEYTPPYGLVTEEEGGVKENVEYSEFYDSTLHRTEVFFFVPDGELDVVAKAQIDAWCAARMGIDCGYTVEMF